MYKILAAIEHWSICSPDELALHSDDGIYTYHQLSEESDKVAYCLSQKGLKPGNRAACLFPPGSKKIISFLGALKAGVTFVIISPNLPNSTIKNLLASLDISAVIGPSYLPNYGPRHIFPEHIETLDKFSCVSAAPTDIAVVTMSSGTTGLPKAIPKTRANLVSRSKTLDHNYIEFSKNTLHFTQFEAHRILRVFTEGHTLFIYDPKSQGISGITAFLAKYKITLMVSFTALFREIESDKDLELNELQAVVIIGEKGFLSDVLKFESLTKPHAVLISIYGSSEYGNMTAYIHRHNQAMSYPAIPLGFALPDDDLRVVDPDGFTTPPNVHGEIIVVSDDIPEGYLNNPEQSAVAFQTLPHSGERAYFTGDMGYFDSDGLLHSVGRKDDQVKIRGNLVNILEVEYALSQAFEVDEMAVSSAVAPSGQNQLTCYYVSNAPVVRKALMDQLRKHLPSHMIPSYFHKIDKLPRTTSGKIMRRSLHELLPQIKDEHYAVAITKHEKSVSAVMAEVLGHANFGREDDFFDVGGDSLAAMTLTFKLEEKFGIHLPLEGLFLEGASVELIAIKIADQTKNTDSISLVPLNYASADKVFYAFPTLNGHLSDYVELGKAMSASAKIIGIRFNRLFSSAWVKPLTLNDIATGAANEIIEQKGGREINLIGFSAAGLLAYETAKLLCDRGHAVERLILIDSNPNTKKTKWPIPLMLFARKVRNISRKVRRKASGIMEKTYAHLYLQNQLAHQIGTPIKVNRSILFEANLGNLTDAEIERWKTERLNGLEIISTEGGHMGLIQKDIAKDIAEKILNP